MNNLLQTYTLLAAGLRADPQFCLASAVVWLDPPRGRMRESVR